MPRSLKELKNFNIGNVTNADSREVPDEGAAMSRGIDPNAPNGMLRGNYQEDYKGNSVNYAKYKVDTTIVLDGATNNTDTTHTLSSVEGLAIGDWVSIGAYAFQILSINSVTKVITTGTTYRWGGFGSTIAVGDGTIVYKIPTPKQLTTYVKDKDNDVENVIIFDKEGSINGIEDLQTNTSGTLGAGINTTFVSDDFTNFPLSMKHGGDISITKRGLSYYLGTGKQTKSKWLGKVGDLALNNKKGFILEDSELYAPDYGSGNNAYDKIVTYQYVTTSSSTLLKTPLINNETGVFHAAFIKGEQWIYIIDGDSGFVNKSIDIGFPITAIAKVTSCVTDARIWLYEEIDDLNTFATKPGKIHCYEIFDLGGTELINLETSTGYPIGIPLTFKHEHDCHWGQTYATGYPSHPIYAQGIHQTTDGDAPVPTPEVTDILETVTSAGAGKLWILASPQGNSENNEWFRTSLLLEGSRMFLHRFMWASYSNIDGDLADGTTVTTYFNDKSMPLAHLMDTGAEYRVSHLTAAVTSNITNSYQNCQRMALSHTSTSIRLMKRSVPGISISGYTEPAKPVDTGLQDYTTTLTWNTATGLDDGEERHFNLVNGGGYWYHDGKTYKTTTNDGTAETDISLTMQWDLTDLTINGGSSHNMARTDSGDVGPHMHVIEGETRWANFKPMPYSLVDVSDLYDGVDHVVGCVVKMSNTTTPAFIEDMWITHHDNESGGSTPDHEVTKGLRLNGMAGKSFLWISNAGRNNYGALYNKSNSFGYDTSDGSDADHLDGLNLSTLCFDKGDDVVRQMKVLGDVIPSTGIASISRNKATHEYNVFNEYNDGDSRFSGLFISFTMEGTLRGLAVRLNTSVEQGDTIDGITDYNGNEVVIIGDHEAGLAGYADSSDDTDLSTSPGVIDNPGTTDAVQQYPANQLASAMCDGLQTVNNLSSLTIQTLADHAGINGSPEAPNEVFPDGPGVISYFDTTNFLRKVWYNRSSATTLSNLYTEAEHSIADNRAIVLRGENFQKAFIVDQGPYEGVSTTDFPDNGTVTKHGYIQPPIGSADFTPSNIDIEDTKDNMIAYVWPKGEPAKSDGTEADDEGRHSQYKASDYYFTYFNKGGKNNLTFGGLSSSIGGGTSRINNFGEAATNDFMYRMYINRLYQYTKYATLEFTDGEDHSDDTHGDFPNFPSAITRYYKISYEYDGFQDSPITSSVYTYKNTTDPATDKHSVDIKIKIPFELNQRVSAVTLWRRGGIDNDTVGEAYVRVARLKLQKGGGWIKVEEASGIFYEQEITDNLIVGQTYQDYTGISETILNSNLNYSISINAGDRLYVAGIKHALLPEGDNSLAWSKIGKFSMFDIANIPSDRIDLGSEVTALAVFNNTLFAFALDRIYKIDTNTNSVIDTIEGFGCSNKDSVVVTEYGMFFADKNHIYKYDGAAVTIISYPIDIDANGSDGWTDLTGTAGVSIRLYFSSKFNLLIALGNSVVASSVTKAFTYHVLKKRWDFRRFEVKDGSSNFNAQSIINNLLIPSKLGGNLYAFTDAEGKGDESTDQSCKLIEVNKGDEQYGQIYWESKDFTMGADTNDKRFIKIKVEASAALTTAPVVYIDGLLNTLVSSGTNEWKIKKNAGTGAVQKGKKIKVQLNSGNDNKEIYSIGIVYRVLKVK